MHEHEKFQEETIKAITDLQNTFAQTQSRQLAFAALAKALVGRVPLEGLGGLLEEYEAEVDNQARQLPPKFQQPQYWAEWSALIEKRRTQLQSARDSKNHAP